MMNYVKLPIVWGSILAIVVVGLGYSYYKKSQTPEYTFTPVERRTLTQEVRVTGTVKPAEKIDLGFEQAGKVASAAVEVGEHVTAGQVIVTLEHADLTARLAQAEANVEVQQAMLEQLRNGPRREDAILADIRIDNARASLDDARETLRQVERKARVDLQNVYQTTLTNMQTTANSGRSALVTAAQMQANSTAMTQAMSDMFGTEQSWITDSPKIGTLTTGVFQAIQNTIADPSQQNIDYTINLAITALQSINNALASIPVSDNSVTTVQSAVNSGTTTLRQRQLAIAEQRAANAIAITQAVSAVTAAQNALFEAEASHDVQLAGARPEEIAIAEARVKAAEAEVASAQALIAKETIVAPMSGTIVLQDAKVGTITSPNLPLVTLISDAQYEIESNVPEGDIAKIAVGDDSNVTLDALGSSTRFPAKVVKIDPAETTVEGVITYTVTFQFVENNNQIKSGMTADVLVTTEKREQIIAIPETLVTETSGRKIVQVKDGATGVNEREVQTGLRGADGYIEIISGLSEGQQVAQSIKK